MNRRGFIGSILALGAAPAVVRASSLMRLWTPSEEIARPTLEEVIRTTIRARAPELADNICRSNALIDLMEMRIRDAERQLRIRMNADIYGDFISEERLAA